MKLFECEEDDEFIDVVSDSIRPSVVKVSASENLSTSCSLDQIAKSTPLLAVWTTPEHILLCKFISGGLPWGEISRYLNRVEDDCRNEWKKLREIRGIIDDEQQIETPVKSNSSDCPHSSVVVPHNCSVFGEESFTSPKVRSGASRNVIPKGAATIPAVPARHVSHLNHQEQKSKRKFCVWTTKMMSKLAEIVAIGDGHSTWSSVAEYVGVKGITYMKCYNKFEGMVKHATDFQWTEEEDGDLLRLMERHPDDWRSISDCLGKTTTDCQYRFMILMYVATNPQKTQTIEHLCAMRRAKLEEIKRTKETRNRRPSPHDEPVNKVTAVSVANNSRPPRYTLRIEEPTAPSAPVSPAVDDSLQRMLDLPVRQTSRQELKALLDVRGHAHHAEPAKRERKPRYDTLNWTKEMDNRLIKAMTQHDEGTFEFDQVADYVQGGTTKAQCMARWRRLKTNLSSADITSVVSSASVGSSDDNVSEQSGADVRRSPRTAVNGSGVAPLRSEVDLMTPEAKRQRMYESYSTAVNAILVGTRVGEPRRWDL